MVLILGIVPLAWSAIDFFFAFTQSSIDSQAEKVTDERDRYIAMKSSRKALLITNYVIGAGEFQGQQMVFRGVGVWPLIYESEAREQIHAWLVARIHLSQHERRAIGTPRIITKPHNHRGEQRVSEMCAPIPSARWRCTESGRCLRAPWWFPRRHRIRRSRPLHHAGECPGYDKKRAHNSGRGLAHAETAYISCGSIAHSGSPGLQHRNCLRAV